MLRGAAILVVDDTPLNIRLLGIILEQAGCRVLSANSAEQARQRIDEQIPELILLDVKMPDIDGYTLCQEIKTDPDTNHIPIIFISALSDAVAKVKGFEVGGADYITKPFQPAEVLARVRHQIKIARLKQALEHEKAQLLRKNQELLMAQRQNAVMFGALSAHLVGKTLDGKYRIDEKIARGGFGVVYRGMHVGLRRQVAIKVFQPANTGATNPQDEVMGLERFRQEGIAACRIRHPNAVDVLDTAISSEGIPYLVMELLTGRTLAQELAQNGRISLGRSVQVIVPVCQVLIEAHATGVVHRDVKPDNIFLHAGDGAEIVKVLDFGIAKLLGQNKATQQETHTRAGGLIGTPSYMAPERLRGQTGDGRTDVYSVGVVFYELLLGHVPFAAANDDIMQLISEHLTKPPPRMREEAPEIPESIEALILSTLQKDPEQRPTMREFLHTLNQTMRTVTCALPTNEES